MNMIVNKDILKKIIYNVVNNQKFKRGKSFINTNPGDYKLDVEIGNYRQSENHISINFKHTYTNYKNPEDVITKYESATIRIDDYIQYVREEKLRDMSITKEDKIRQYLNDYLEFDSDELFRDSFNLVRIFGGAIRDIIAEQPINDVDILCGSKAIKYVESVLSENGYQFMNSLNGKDLQVMYSDIHIINEPHTWIKGSKIVQLIRPVVNPSPQSTPASIYEKGFKDLISNVDLSCCGVSYDGKKLYEDYPNAILHCQNKVFSVNIWAKMYSDKRVSHRKVKLSSRGWEEIENKTSVNRGLKLDLIV